MWNARARARGCAHGNDNESVGVLAVLVMTDVQWAAPGLWGVRHALFRLDPDVRHSYGGARSLLGTRFARHA